MIIRPLIRSSILLVSRETIGFTLENNRTILGLA